MPIDRFTIQARHRMVSLIVMLLATFTVMVAHAATPAQVQQRFEARFGHIPVEGVTLTPYGLYEVRVRGNTLLYTDADVRFVLEGNLIDTATRSNVTQARMEQLNAVDFSKLPLELAFTQVRGNGKQKIAIFEDPNCGYCKQLRQTLQSLNDVTIHTFMYPILSPDSNVKVHSTWCADDKAGVWDAWMLQGKSPAAAECGAPMQEFIALGQRLNVRGTPTIIFEDGSRASGALPLAMLQQRIEKAGR